jgi:hypothetical protein
MLFNTVTNIKFILKFLCNTNYQGETAKAAPSTPVKPATRGRGRKKADDETPEVAKEVPAKGRGRGKKRMEEEPVKDDKEDAAKSATGRGRGKRKMEEEPAKDAVDGAKEDGAEATKEEPVAKKKATAGGAGKKVEVAFRYGLFFEKFLSS